MAITKAIPASPLLQPSIYSSHYFLNLQFPTHSLSTICKRNSLFQGINSRHSFPKYLNVTATKVDAVYYSHEVKKRGADISSELKGTSIFLVGMKSSLKSSTGKLLADALRYYYFDSDSLVEEVAGGASALKSYRETDEKGFLQSETEVLKQLSSMGRLVVCAGDGGVQSSTNLALLRHGISLWIDVPLELLASEGHTSTSHPEVVVTQLIETYEKMRGGYATADATISLQKVCGKLGYDELDSVTTEDMALEILKELEKLTRVKKMMEEAARPF
ncbi:probable inactive shikimate kinase like 1, chloroplastic isoform X2 [Euphorbia lathyris]|uniref:probable inactive shikimate kinase like 1, chloroplastic isoform X2 n=1 Tax=Euphorbia lathyris TaxID=212925 RepID=UPI003313A684